MSKKIARKLSDEVSKIPFVGRARASAFERLGIFSVEDLLNFVPRRVVDFTNPEKIKNLAIGDRSPILAKVSQVEQRRTFRKRMSVTRALLSDDSGSIEAVWFNQPYLKRTFQKEKKYLFFGEVRTDRYSFNRIYSNPEFFRAAGVFPIYAQTKNLTTRQIGRAIKNAIDVGYELPEFMSDSQLKHLNLPDNKTAISHLHFPRNIDEYEQAKDRIILNRLIELILKNLFAKKENEKYLSKKINTKKFQNKINQFIKSLPFELTGDQFEVVGEIMTDLEISKPMNRVVRGDVGSGKTIVALLASLPVIWSGQRVVWLAPTQVLSTQHYRNINDLVGDKIKVALLSSSSKKGDTESADLIVGTHALLQKGVSIEKLGLVVVDEQHRFGVEQRGRLMLGKVSPNFLSLTATPIPRTLSHIIFGNCEISTIKSKPKGRKKIKTFVVPEPRREDSYRFINNLIELGQKVFIICPSIGNEIDPEGDRKAVMHEAQRIKSTAIGSRNIQVLHGQMKPSEKEKAFAEFAFGGGEVLLSTSVVEVGVDVPEATVMVVEDAHNFGLSQLHQFRGRIGRSSMQSYCFCFSQNLDNEKSRKRLKVFVQNDDGFKLAEYDLKFRGPGALAGLEQSGFSDIDPSWLGNARLISAAKKIANKMIKNIEKLPHLYGKIKSNLKTSHLE